jgi:hypothetical protein
VQPGREGLALLLKALGCQPSVGGRHLLHEVLVLRAVFARGAPVGFNCRLDALEQVGQLSDFHIINSTLLTTALAVA